MREKRRRPKSVNFSIFLQGLLLGFSELEQVRARSFQIVKFNGVAPRPGGVAHLAKSSFRSGPMFPASVPACFLAGGAVFEPNRGNIKGTDFLVQNSPFLFLPLVPFLSVRTLFRDPLCR